MPIPEVGAKAPSFSLPDQSGKTHKLSDYQGKFVVLYFYPKDDTPGCTKEACAFRDDERALTKSGAVVLGVSPDDTKSHEKFATKFSLNFPLLADPDHAVAEKYGAWGEKSMYGRTYEGIVRSTFLIDPKGKVARVWPKVKVDGHSEEVRTSISELS
jgi:thioredoxin-dependent peroxiredoxin